MSYNPTEWVTGDVVTSEKLNNIEGGIVDNTNALEPIGSYVSVQSSLSSLPVNTETDLCTARLTEGVWIVCSYLRFARGGENFQASLAISTASGSSQAGSIGYTQFPVTQECNVPAVGTVRTFNLDAPTDIYVVGWHNGTSAKNILSAQMQAIRIK